jgi:hypothetical protein
VDKFVAAWEAWRPNGQALVAAGDSARKAGDMALAQRLFDRAMVDLEKATGKRLSLEVPNGFSSVEAMAWSSNGKRLAVADGAEIVVLDTTTWRERIRLRGHTGSVNSVARAR